MRTDTATFEPRPTCYTCFRPETHCVCGLVAPFRAHTNLLLLQHPHERKKYYSTSKIVSQAIVNLKLVRGLEFAPGEIHSHLQGQTPYLLFPSRSAIDCTEVVLDDNSAVIVVDGTWDEAGKILFRNPELRNFPCLTFKAPLRSNYRIRKQPKENYLSTLESIAHLLKLNATAHGLTAATENYDRLLEGFDRMVTQQLQYFPRMGENRARGRGRRAA
jgi:DTW domain-containing protein YfiP